MKTDRELLELAAKAYFAQEVADGTCSFRWDEKEGTIVFSRGDNQDHNGSDSEFLFSPLDEDGCALRLAVKLGIQINGAANSASANGIYWFAQTGERDPNAATSRAIVRAAAAIGEGMP